MARLALVLIATLAATAQTDFQRAGVCSRCHVVQVIEWSSSKHVGAAVACQACHGPSAGHVANERNQVKPDRLARDGAIAALCAGCHARGCPKSARRDGCQECHHQHALADPKAKLEPMSFGDEERLARFRRSMEEGERRVQAGEWTAARTSFAEAAKLVPTDRRARLRLRMAERRIDPGLVGVVPVGAAFDDTTGLPRVVRAAAVDMELVLVPGGEVEMGSDRFASSRPVHSVRVDPFYLGRTEVTQRQWSALATGNPSLKQGPDLPVHGVSWADSVQWIAKLGPGFRLPTEAEWEFAADDPGAMRARESEAPPGPRGVGGLGANRWGLHEMYGNVAEWCSSLLRPYPYQSRDGREDAQAPGLRAIRGGSYADSPGMVHRALRHGDRPERRIPWNGFRVALGVR
jgi:formylglycine-generating enzyme required for sulfatase activity